MNTFADKKKHSERGAVLIVVVILSAIALAVATSLLYMVTAGTKISGMEKRYRTARDASYGAVEVLGQVIFSKQSNTTTAFLTPLNTATPVDTSGCASLPGAQTANGLSTKILLSSSAWNSSCNKSSLIDPAVLSTYDISFEIGTNPVYRVYAKIIDTMQGNTLGSYGGKESGGRLDTHSGVVTTASELPVVSVPYSYLMEIDTRNLSDTSERSRLSVFYHY